MSGPKYLLEQEFLTAQSKHEPLRIVAIALDGQDWRYRVQLNGKDWSSYTESRLSDQMMPAISQQEKNSKAVICPGAIPAVADIYFNDDWFECVWHSDAKGPSLAQVQASRRGHASDETRLAVCEQADTYFRGVFQGQKAAPDFVRTPPFTVDVAPVSPKSSINSEIDKLASPDAVAAATLALELVARTEASVPRRNLHPK